MIRAASFGAVLLIAACNAFSGNNEASDAGDTAKDGSSADAGSADGSTSKDAAVPNFCATRPADILCVDFDNGGPGTKLVADTSAGGSIGYLATPPLAGKAAMFSIGADNGALSPPPGAMLSGNVGTPSASTTTYITFQAYFPSIPVTGSWTLMTVGTSSLKLILALRAGTFHLTTDSTADDQPFTLTGAVVHTLVLAISASHLALTVDDGAAQYGFDHTFATYSVTTLAIGAEALGMTPTLAYSIDDVEIYQ